FQRVGGEESINADVRVIAATNTDLKKMTDTGEFRRDLYYRLNVFPIEIPTLSERREDIQLFVEIFLKKLNQFSSKWIRDINPDVLQAFMRYPWPGNIRELQNLIERAHIIEQSSVLTPESFPGELFENETGAGGIRIDASLTLKELRQAGVEQMERLYLKEILTEERGSVSNSARRAGITTRQLSKLMNKYSLHKEDFKAPKGAS
ncbi:MAG: sigma-54-dependent Fis family transcriptional regulator, partial [Syntrophobacterales bacterium]